MLEVEEVAEALAVDLDSGLSSAEAARRLAADGPNELRATPPVPIWRKILAQFQDPLIYLLLVAVVISLVAWVLGGRVGWPVDAIVIAVVVILNAFLGYVQEAPAESAVAALPGDDRSHLRSACAMTSWLPEYRLSSWYAETYAALAGSKAMPSSAQTRDSPKPQRCESSKPPSPRGERGREKNVSH